MAGRFQNKIWLLGDGRSGTTWLSNLVNYSGRYRLVFEPFHPTAEQGMLPFGALPYVRPGESYPEFEAYVRSVFSGRFQSYWSDQFTRGFWFEGLLVKSIFSHLFAAWAAGFLPGASRLLILRHPCAVAASKRALRFQQEPTDLLQQAALRQDYLEGHESLIRRTRDPFLKYVLFWSILHSVLLSQASEAGWFIVYYERLCLEPEPELTRMFQYLGRDGAAALKDPKLRAMFTQPSQTTRPKDAPKSVQERAVRWIDEVDKALIPDAMEILAEFGLDHLYGEDPLPKSDSPWVRTAVGK